MHLHSTTPHAPQEEFHPLDENGKHVGMYVCGQRYMDTRTSDTEKVTSRSM